MHTKLVSDGLIMLGITGSHAYGTNIPGSDFDIKGITIPPIKYFIGTKRFDSKETWPEDEYSVEVNPNLSPDVKDKVVYSISKFLSLAQSQNPNILDLLWLPPACMLHTSSIYKELRALREYLLSKKVFNSFGGYAAAQIKKMETHRKWLLAEAEGKVQTCPKLQDYTPEGYSPSDMLGKDELYSFYEFLVSLLKGKFQYFQEYPDFVELGNRIDWKGLIKQNGLEESQNDYIKATTNCSDRYITLLHATQLYLGDLKRYESWKAWKKNRNPERAAIELKCGFDGKNASHCIRLQTMAIEILTTGQVNVRRTSDADYLIAIRKGQITYEEVVETCASLKSQTVDAYKNSILPDDVDVEFWDKWLVDTLSYRFRIR